MQASKQTEPTPVIITSNTNMCVVTDGNSKTFEHQQPLQDHMFKLELTYRLELDFGKVTKRDVKDFFAWAAANEQPVSRDFCEEGGLLQKAHPGKGGVCKRV